MAGYEEILRIKQETELHLRSLPGVHAVGIGNKVIDGKMTDEVAIAAFVVKKKPLSDLTGDQIVPAEIQGIKTDVVEMPIATRHSGNPTNITKDISADKKSISFHGSKNKPGDGLVITVEFSATPSTTVPPNFAVTYETRSFDTLDDILKALSKAINQSTSFTNVTATTTLDSLVIAGKDGTGTTVAINRCNVVGVDDKKYFKDWVRGGIQTQVGGVTDQETFGTLGCLATMSPSPGYPQGKVVGITCHHIMEPMRRKSTNLIATKNAPVVTFSKSPDDTEPIPAATVLEISFPKPYPNPSEAAYYQTVTNDTLTNIAQKINAAVNTLPYEHSDPSGSTGISISDVELTVSLVGPPDEDSDSKLKAKVEAQVLTFSGNADEEGYGVFVELHPGVTYQSGNIYPSFSIFYNPPKKASAVDVAKNVAKAINDFPLTPEKPQDKVTASQTDTQVTIHHAEVVECAITSDFRVGQPDASFCSVCSPCCSHRIGIILDSRMDLDVALIQLDAGLQYKPEVQGIGLINGVAAPKVGMEVVKRGRSSDVTHGTVKYVGVSGTTGDTLRQFTNAFLVQSKTFDPFSSQGDSGAAVLSSSNNQVVGILFGGANLQSLATPWDHIVAAFPGLNPNPDPAPGQARHAVRTVPKSAAQMAALTAEDVHPIPGRRLGRRMEEAEREIVATPAGLEYAALVRHHFAEVHSLITKNNRMGVAWKRNGGPQMIEAFMRMLQHRDQHLPMEIDGKPIIDCLVSIKDALSRYGSADLVADLTKFMPRLATFVGYSYDQLLSALQSESGS